MSLASIIDYTLLRPDATRAEIETLCDDALRLRFATVCVTPSWVRICADRGVRVCTVIAFPFGTTLPDVKALETRMTRDLGAVEFDMVLNRAVLAARDDAAVGRDIEAVVRAAAGGIVKVILETAALTEELKILGCTLSQRAGAHFVKTSTGFGPGGATETDVALLRRSVPPSMGVKASGGIRDVATTRRMVDAGATRIGTSAGVAIADGERG